MAVVRYRLEGYFWHVRRVTDVKSQVVSLFLLFRTGSATSEIF